MRFRRKPVLVAIACLVVVSSGVFAWALRGDETPLGYPPLEDVARTGFAVWPEDSDEEARVACTEKTDEEPWRLSAEGTALRFAKQVMGHEKASIDNHTTSADDAATIMVSAPSVFLSNILELRRYGGCWYVVRGDYREDSGGPTLIFARDQDRTRVYLEANELRDLGLYEIGFGPHRKVLPTPEGERSWLLPEGLRQEGHIVSFSPEGGELESVFARKLPPPPEFGSGTRVFPSAHRFSWESLPKGGPRGLGCRRTMDTGDTARDAINETIENRFAEALPLAYPDAEGKGPHDRISKRVRVDRLNGRDWKVTIDGVAFLFRLIRATDRCWALDEVGRLDERPLLGEALVGDSEVTVGFSWGEATRVDFSLDYGFERLAGSIIHRDAGSPVGLVRQPQRETIDDPQVGQIFMTAIRDGRYVNAYSRRLPPLPVEP